MYRRLAHVAAGLLCACGPTKVEFPDDCDELEWYADLDGDGFGDPHSPVDACDDPDGAVDQAGDCDDTDPEVTTCRWSGEAILAEVADAVLVGEDANDRSGMLVAHAGDVDGDGQGDALVGTVETNEGEGGVYLALGPLSGERDLSTADAVIRQTDTATNSNYLYDMGPLGDLDGDGYDDLRVIDYNASGSEGAYGALWVHEGPLDGDVDLEDAAITVEGSATWGTVGIAPAGAADLDDDGTMDLVLPGVTTVGDSVWTGALLFLDPAHGTLTPEDAELSVMGSYLSYVDEGGAGTFPGGMALGDWDGDGTVDLVLGSPDSDVGTLPTAGAIYAWSGPFTHELGPDDADAVLSSTYVGSQLGVALVAAGDMDGDGHEDLFASAPYAGTSVYDAGAAFLFLGPIAGELSTDAAAAMVHASEDTILQLAPISAGDLDMDGVGDFAVAFAGGASGTGDMRLIYGPVEGAVSANEAAVDAIFETGGPISSAVLDVSLGGDLNGDDWPDALVGLPADIGGISTELSAGRTYLLSGGL